MTATEINESLQNVVNQYITSLDSYSDTLFYAKKDELTWSLGQMYEHLLTSANFFFLANVARCLEQRKGQEGGEKNKFGENAFQYGGFPPVKITMPEALRGADPVAKTQSEYRELLSKVLSDAEKQVEAVSQNDGVYKTYHPALGWLNAYEWFYNLEMHFRHHLRQKAELESWAKSTVK
jgi:hypothetical protein